MDDEEYINQLEEGLENSQSRNNQLASSIHGYTAMQQKDANLIYYQIDPEEILNKVEHFLRGDMIKTDDLGNENYVQPEDKDLIPLNEYGINSILHKLSNYINKYTVLSWYDEPRINEILADIGDTLADYIFCNYEKMGMNTDYKKSKYNMIVLSILHIIESAYRRALHGKTLQGLNESRIVTQSDSLGRPMPIPQKKKSRWFNPFSWR